MRDIYDYIEVAKARTGCESDNQLAKVLGVKRQYVSLMRQGELPGVALMMRLAEAAGIDPREAYCEWSFWRQDRAGNEAARQAVLDTLELVRDCGAGALARTSLPRSDGSERK